MRTITFYSFKGGVGRTMALVNVAAELVRWGRKVLVVDFDLEAPGLETYSQLSPKEQHAGVVEYVTEYMNSGQVPDILKFVYRANIKVPAKEGKTPGELFVMPAGKRRDVAYRRALVNLNWKRLYFERDGFLFFEETKKAWEEEFKPDYVLIDSRTGDTDVLGICTRQLPDSVVLLFVPNEQNVAGLEGVCRDIRREETEGLKKKIPLHFVPSNIPNLDDENQILRRQLRNARKRLEIKNGFAGIIRRYESLELLDQLIATLDRPRSRLAKSYRRLTETLMKENFRSDRDGALFYLNNRIHESLPRVDEHSEKNRRLGLSNARDDRSERDYRGRRRGKPDPPDPLNVITHLFDKDANVLNRVAESWIVQGEIDNAIKVLNLSLTADETQDVTFRLRARCKKSLGKIDGAADDLLKCIAMVPVSEESIAQGTVMGDLQYAIYELRDIAPNRLVEAADVLCAQELDFETCMWITDCLLETDDGIPAAAKLLKNQLKKHKVQSEHLLELVFFLAEAKCWRELIELYETHSPNDFHPGHSFSMAIAYWAQNGRMPREICEAAVRSGSWRAEQSIWLHWGANQNAEALKWLEHAERIAKEHGQGSIEADGMWGEMYPWSLKNVSDHEPYSTEKYLEECHKLRRFIQGETADRPPFLRPSTE